MNRLGAMLDRLSVPVVVGLALVLRLAWVLLIPTVPFGDADHFFTIAGNLAAGEGFCLVPGQPTAYRAPGYPFFLSLAYVFPDPLLAGKLLNVGCLAGAVGLVAPLAQRLGLSRRAGLGAALLLALYPNHVAYASLLMSEPLTQVLFLGALLCMLQARGRVVVALAAGSLSAALVLVRPQFLFLLPILALLGGAGRWRQQVGLAAMVLGGVLLAVAGWSARNAVVLGDARLSTNGGVNLYVGNNPEATGRYMEPRWPRERPRGDEVAFADFAGRLARDYLRAHPLEAMARIPLKVYFVLAPYAEGVGLAREGLVWGRAAGWRQASATGAVERLQRSLIWLAHRGTHLVVGGIYLGLAVWGWRQCRPGAWWRMMVHPAVVSLAYILAIQAVYFGGARFIFPVFPLLVILAVEGARTRNV